jgi:hypothetical protein
MKKSKYYLDSIDGLHMAITPMFGQSRARRIKCADSKMAKMEFIKTDPLYEGAFLIKPMAMLFSNVGKAGFGIGGASGNGAVYEHTLMGWQKLSQ